VLSPDVPKVVMQNLRGNVEAFLAEHKLTLNDIKAMERTLEAKGKKS